MAVGGDEASPVASKGGRCQEAWALGPGSEGAQIAPQPLGIRAGDAILAATFFACCAAHSGPIFPMVSYAIGRGVPAMAGVSIGGYAWLYIGSFGAGLGAAAMALGLHRSRARDSLRAQGPQH